MELVKGGQLVKGGSVIVSLFKNVRRRLPGLGTVNYSICPCSGGARIQIIQC